MGGLTGAIWSIIMAWHSGWVSLPFFAVAAAVVFPIGGYIWGWIMWTTSEQLYREAISASEDPNG